MVLARNILNFNTNDNKTDDPNNSKMLITSPIKHLKCVSLKSVELPLYLPNIRNDNGSTILSITLKHVSFYTIPINLLQFNHIPSTLGYTNYTDIIKLINDLNSEIVLQLKNLSQVVSGIENISLVFDVSPYTNQLRLTATGINPNPANLKVNKNVLSQMLGFNGNEVFQVNKYTGNTEINANLNFNLQSDNYVNMFLKNLPITSTNANGSNGTFKIPLTYSIPNNFATTLNQNIVYPTTYWYNNIDTLQQVVYIEDNNFILDSIQVNLYDKWGFPILCSSYNFSFQLEIEYDKK
jgi:hypothetical protein